MPGAADARPGPAEQCFLDLIACLTPQAAELVQQLPTLASTILLASPTPSSFRHPSSSDVVRYRYIGDALSPRPVYRSELTVQVCSSLCVSYPRCGGLDNNVSRRTDRNLGPALRRKTVMGRQSLVARHGLGSAGGYSPSRPHRRPRCFRPRTRQRRTRIVVWASAG
jgi:hypothetical protein